MDSVQPSSETETTNTKSFSLADFDLGVPIGSGRFGRVYLAKEKKMHLLVAIKKIDKKAVINHGLEKQVLYEMYIHSQMKHKNIARMFTYFHDKESLYFVLQYACKGSLYMNMRQQKYKRFSQDLAAKYIYQTADALIYCHGFDFFHGDVKPENILLDTRDEVKLSDFGLAWPRNGTAHTRNGLFGTRDYVAPEQLNNEMYDERIDHWSLGVLCFELLVGRNPFSSKHRELTTRRILDVDIKFPKVVTPEAQDLILKLVTYDPDDRLPLESVLTHKWITSNYSNEGTV